MRTGFLTLVYGLMLSFSALAAPFDNIITHNAAVPEQSFQLAATWFLPDWQASSSSRSETAPSGSGDRHDLTCSTYGGCAGIPANMTCSQSFRVDGTNCYKSCTCKSGYNRVSSSDVCAGCVNPCDTVTAVPTPYGCQTAWAVCPSKCQVAYPDNCRNRNAVSSPYGCKTTFADCSSKCQVAYPDNCHNRTAVATPYGCQSAFADCSSKCQTAYPDNCRNYSSKPLKSGCANGCALGKTISDCSSRCSTGCKAKCETGYKLSADELSCTENGCSTGYEAGKTCGAGYELVKSGQSGTQYCGKCVVKACTAGSTSCSGATVAKENGYYSGDNKCYTCQTCEQAGKKTCNGSCIATSECCGGCAAGQACQNGSCVSTMACISPYSLSTIACTSPYKLIKQSTNQACGMCENQCSGYQQASLVKCPDISYISEIMTSSPGENGIWTNMGSPALGTLENCPYDNSYKKCIFDCYNVTKFIKGNQQSSFGESSGIMGSMWKTKCNFADPSDLRGLVHSCEYGIGGNHKHGDYLLYQDLLNIFKADNACGLPIPTPYQTCTKIGFLSCPNS